MFYALINNKINHKLEIEVDFFDIAELNTHALDEVYDISKISFNLLPQVTDTYHLLSSGSALGKGCGPLLISKSLDSISKDKDYTCLIPGIHTTANFLLSTLYPKITSKEESLFSDIEDRLLAKEADLGLVIHETRFTYAERGLNNITDLGTEWEESTGLPIPLGGIVAKRTLSHDTISSLQSAIQKSIEYAHSHEEEALEYCKSYAQDMRNDIMRSHIGLYVNDYSVDLGEEGRKTILFMLEKMKENRQIDKIPLNVFF